jgi:hypothetical protein
MKRSTLMIALGGKPPADGDDEIEETSESEEEDDSAIDEAIKTFLDTEADMETRVTAFRSAVKGCY